VTDSKPVKAANKIPQAKFHWQNSTSRIPLAKFTGKTHWQNSLAKLLSTLWGFYFQEYHLNKLE
jgi:hypothetical protein